MKVYPRRLKGDFRKGLKIDFFFDYSHLLLSEGNTFIAHYKDTTIFFEFFQKFSGILGLSVITTYKNPTPSLFWGEGPSFININL